MRKQILSFIQEIALKFLPLFCSFCLIFILGNKAVLSYPFVDLNFSENSVVEQLRLYVPKQSKDAWIKAEKASWQPWLEHQKGFVERQIYWDPETEEATLLITWEDRSKWKSIPESEIEAIQTLFEMIAREETGQEFGNPFPLVFTGELFPQ